MGLVQKQPAKDYADQEQDRADKVGQEVWKFAEKTSGSEEGGV